MQKQRLKLKQASAVLQIAPKELQNLVQFGVVKPKRFEGTYLFDANTLMVAKVAFCLKESLGCPQQPTRGQDGIRRPVTSILTEEERNR